MGIIVLLNRENELVETYYWQIIGKGTKLSPLFQESNFKTGGNFIIGSAYGIRTRDLLLEREVS